jgi:subtilisin family serine protease
LDSGFRGYAAHLGWALPQKIEVRSFRFDRNLEAKASQHGILCAEVIHAIAPEAELLFANWQPDHPQSFLAAVRWARDRGARIISCSVIMPSWSDGEGGGAFSRDLAEIVGTGDSPGDVLFFACAGNTAQRHWKGFFHPAPDGLHQWAPDETVNMLFPWQTEEVSVEIYSRGNSVYDAEVSDARTHERIGKSRAGCEADYAWSWTRFQPRDGESYEVRARLRQGSPSEFNLVVLGGSLRYAVAAGSVSCPADGHAVVAVGAVTMDGDREPYSSCGPIARSLKPDLVAPVPFPSVWRHRPFCGTSAAAPQAAGLAALYWSGHSTLPASHIRTVLDRSARDVGLIGDDCETGHGMIRLPSPDLALQSHFTTPRHPNPR